MLRPALRRGYGYTFRRNIGGKDIAVAAHGFDQAAFAPLVPQAGAQTADLHIKAAVKGTAFRFAPLTLLLKYFTAQNLAGMFQQQLQQTKFRAAQIDHHAFGIPQMARDEIQRPAVEAVRPALVFGFVGPGGRIVSGTAQHGADAGQQFARFKRLDNIVVCADFKAHYPISSFSQSGKKNDRRVGFVCLPAFGAQGAAQGEAVFSGHHDVQHEQIKRAGGQFLPHFRAVRRAFHGKTMPAEIVCQQAANIAVVVHDQKVECVAVFRRKGRSIRHGVFSFAVSG